MVGKIDLDAGDHVMEIESGGIELDAGIGRHAHTLIKRGFFTGLRTVGENLNTVLEKKKKKREAPHMSWPNIAQRKKIVCCCFV